MTEMNKEGLETLTKDDTNLRHRVTKRKNIYIYKYGIDTSCFAQKGSHLSNCIRLYTFRFFREVYCDLYTSSPLVGADDRQINRLSNNNIHSLKTLSVRH